MRIMEFPPFSKAIIITDLGTKTSGLATIATVRYPISSPQAGPVVLEQRSKLTELSCTQMP